MKILYIDAAAGASGDMLAGALLDLGWPIEQLQQLLQKMSLEHEVTIGLDFPVHQSIRATRLKVELLEHHQHDHHGHGHHNHGHHGGRSLSHILELLARLPQAIAEPAGRVFQNLASAEAKVHGTDVEQVHFHEVGAIDAIVDIVAVCAGLAWLKPERVICSPLPLGRGFVNCAHGCLPLPAPAVLNLLQGVPVTAWAEEVETVTPTGAALLSTLADEFGAMPAFSLLKSGIGGGSRISKQRANVLRLLWGEREEGLSDQVAEISCNLDDQLGEDFPLISERLMNAGALDVAATALLMKKGRPALRIDVLCPVDKTQALANLLLNLSTSLGVRVAIKKRYLLPRQQTTINTPWGEVRVKSASLDGNELRHHPEAEDVLAISRSTGLAPSLIRQKIMMLLATR